MFTTHTMYRRELVAAITVALGGCLGSASPPGADVGERTQTDSIESETAPPASTVLEYGDWYETAPTNVRVTGTSTRQRLETASTPDDAILPDTDLAILSAEIENAGDSRLDLAEDVDVSFAVVASDQLFPPVTTRSDEREASIDLSQISVGAGTHLASASAQLPPGERVSVWQAVLVPSRLSSEAVQVTMCRRGDDCAARWKPATKMCDCPG